MVCKNDLVVEKIGQVLDNFDVSDTTKDALFDEMMYHGTKPLGLVWARGKSTAQIGTECSETHQRAISICSSVLDIARHYSTFVNKRSRLRSSIQNVLESHVTCTLPFELGDDASDFVDELTKRCAQFAGDQIVKKVADLLVDLESLDVLPRSDNACNLSENGTSDSEDNSESQLSKLSDEDSEMESDSESGENDEGHEESEASVCTDGEEEGKEPKTQLQTHNTASDESKLPIRKRAASYHDSENSEDDMDEAMRISRACKRAR
jgi:Mg-chelatase subunit ChlI